MSSPPAPDSDGNIFVISIFITYLLTCLGLFTLIFLDLISKFKTLQSSPLSIPKPTKRHLLLFTALTLTSVLLTWYYMISFFQLSYRVWEYESVVDVNSYSQGLQLGPWLRDVELFRDAWEVVLETPQRLVWSQPIFFITAGWSIFLGLEGQRRKIKHTWAYMLLGQIVAICFAQNLFYLAILLSPLPTPTPPISNTKTTTSSNTDSKPTQTWTPTLTFFTIPLTLTFLAIALIPSVTNTPLFLPILYIPHIFLLLPPLLSRSLPYRYGKFHPTPQAAARYYRVLFQGIFLIGLVFEIKVLAAAVMDDSADKHEHRHSVLYPGSWREGEGPWKGVWTAFGDHPAVRSVGWDSVVCLGSGVAWLWTRSELGVGGRVKIE